MYGDRLHAGITMTVSPDFAEYRPDQTVGHPAAPHDADINGNGHGNFVGAEVRTPNAAGAPRQAARKKTFTRCPPWHY